MTNNDEFEQQDYNPTEELPPKRSLSNNLTEAWRSRPLFKLMILMIAVAAIVAASVSFFGSSKTANNSHLVNPPALKSAPGGPASPYMQQQTDLANKDRAQEAMQNGGSALPTPIGQTTDMGAINDTTKKNDPLNALKAEVERMKQEQQRTTQQNQQVTQQQQQRQEQFDDSLAQAMQRQLSQLMDGWTPKGVKEVTVLKGIDGNALGTAGEGNSVGANKGAADASVNATPPAKVLVQAGTVSYAQLLTEANSDVPGPILASILSGPFAGARAVGQFQVANGFADYLVLQFNLVNWKGKDYPMNGVALDPDTTLGGMATEVDQRYFTRVVLPAAAGFMQGFGSALGQGSSSVVTNGTTTVVSQSGKGVDQGVFQGLSQGAQTVGQFFQNQANLVKPLVRVAAGTPIGLFFVSSVTDTTLQQQYPNGVAGVNGTPGVTGIPGTAAYPANNYGAYPGATVAGYGGQMQNNNLPYPNYAMPTNTNAPYGASPYSAFPSTIPQSYGTGYYGH